MFDFDQELKSVEQLIKTLPMSVVSPAAKRALQKHGRMFNRTMVESMRGSVDNKGIVHRRTGSLARALSNTVVEMQSRTALYVWFDSTIAKYWKTQEYGAEISAKPGKMLAIPAKAAMTPAGVSKFTSPRDVPGLFMIKRFQKAPMLGRIEGKKIVIYFYLTKKISVPARLGMRDKWKESLPLALPIFKEEISKELLKVIGLK